MRLLHQTVVELPSSYYCFNAPDGGEELEGDFDFDMDVDNMDVYTNM